jgi:uncharacterized membrane protein
MTSPGNAEQVLRYDRDTPEFARVVNLSDAVFAIAMTLLVLTLDPPSTSTGFGAEMVDQLPQLVAFVLAFALVANLWWQHHKLMALFKVVEPGMVGILLALLGAVALVPYPTSLVGNAPGERAAVLTFIGVFVVLALLFLLLVLRARQAAAFRDVVSDRSSYLLIGQWSAGIFVLLVAALLTLRSPTVGLSVLALNIVLGPLAARRGATGRQRLINRYLPDD